MKDDSMKDVVPETTKKPEVTASPEPTNTPKDDVNPPEEDDNTETEEQKNLSGIYVKHIDKVKDIPEIFQYVFFMK